MTPTAHANAHATESASPKPTGIVDIQPFCKTTEAQYLPPQWLSHHIHPKLGNTAAKRQAFPQSAWLWAVR
jgi:hypothetical protein